MDYVEFVYKETVVYKIYQNITGLDEFSSLRQVTNLIWTNEVRSLFDSEGRIVYS